MLRLPGAAGPTTGSVAGDGEPLRLVVLGESTAAGVGASTHETALTGQLAAALGGPVSWRVLSKIGATAADARTRLVPQLDGAAADLVVVVLGVNDTKNLHSVRRWTTDLLRLIIDLRRAVGPVPVVLTGVPPMDAFPGLPQPVRALAGMRSRRMDAAAARVAARVRGVRHVSTPRWILTPELFCTDGLHPSEDGYRLWAEHVVRNVRQ